MFGHRLIRVSSSLIARPATLRRSVLAAVQSAPVNAMAVLSTGIRAFATAKRATSRAAPAKKRASSVKRASSKSPRRATAAASSGGSSTRRRSRARSTPRASPKRSLAARRRAAKKAADEKKERAAVRKSDLRARRTARLEEAKAKRAARREQLRERKFVKQQREKEHAAEVRDRLKMRTMEKKAREYEENLFKKLKVKSAAGADPNKPKRALNAYSLFYTDRHAAVRAELKAKNPTVPITAVAKAIGAEWKALSPEAKKPYQDKAATGLAASRAARAEYDSKIPQKPAGSYTRFSASRVPAIVAASPELKKKGSLPEIARRVAAEWKALDEAAKKPFEDAYKSELEKYRVELDAFITKQLEKVPEDLRGLVRGEVPTQAKHIPLWVANVNRLIARELAASAKEQEQLAAAEKGTRTKKSKQATA